MLLKLLNLTEILLMYTEHDKVKTTKALSSKLNVGPQTKNLKGKVLYNILTYKHGNIDGNIAILRKLTIGFM